MLIDGKLQSPYSVPYVGRVHLGSIASIFNVDICGYAVMPPPADQSERDFMPACTPWDKNRPVFVLKVQPGDAVYLKARKRKGEILVTRQLPITTLMPHWSLVCNMTVQSPSEYMLYAWHVVNCCILGVSLAVRGSR